MAETDYIILTPSDALVSELFKIFESEWGREATFAIRGSATRLDRSDPLFQELMGSSSHVIGNANVDSGAVQLIFYGSQRLLPSGLVNNAIYSTIRLVIRDEPREKFEQTVRLQIKLSNFIRQHALYPLENTQDEESEIHTERSVLSAVNVAAQDQIVRTNEFFRDLIDRFDTRQKTLDDEYSRKNDALKSTFEENRQALETERAQVAEERRELDDRSNTHARRAIRGELLTMIQGRQAKFALSPETSKIRTPIHIVYVISLLCTGFGAVYSMYVWGTATSESWDAKAISSALKTFAFTFAFLTGGGLYISWMNRWFDKRTDAEFQARQFEIDINRASWAVEAALEWKAVQREQMPDALLSGVTKHLFESASNVAPEYSPLETLATGLLGSASNIKMKIGENEVSYDRKAVERMAKSDAGRQT